jgi:hypothetical protein
MDAVIARIKAYALVINASLQGALDLDFVVNLVVDRALVYMNRAQLKADYEEDLAIYDESDDIWDDYPYPIPLEIERVLAMAVVSAYRTVVEQTSGTNAVRSMEDNGQRVEYQDKLMHYFNSGDDAEIFSGMTKMLDRYRLATVIKDHYRHDRLRPL